MLTLVSCAMAACAGRAPTRPVVAASVREHGSTNAQRSEAVALRDLAEIPRDSLSESQAGYYLDVLQGRLLTVLGTDAKLSRTQDRIGIDLAHRVPLDAVSPWLGATGCRLLRPLADALVEFRKTVIAVKVGDDGADKEATALAGRHARAVAACLSMSGIASRRIVIAAMRPAMATSVTDAASDKLELDVVLILRDAKNQH